jgi:hypothetical protein
MIGIFKRAKWALAIAASAMVFSVAAPAISQEVPPEQLALARKYVDLTDKAGVFEIALVEIAMGTLQQIIQQNPELGEAADNAIRVAIEATQPKKDELFGQFARVYATIFTTEELAEIVKFYESPVGQKLATANAELSPDLQSVMQVFNNNIRPEFFAKVRAELKAKGFDV